MNVAVLIPYRPGQPARDRAYAYVRARYESAHPEWPVLTADSPAGFWSKGRALARARVQTTADVFVVADADCFLSAAQLDAAVTDVLDGAVWVMPHSTVYRLSRLGTARLYTADVLMPTLSQRHPAPHGGGIVIVRADAYDNVGGIDPRFTDWGGEDLSFARALDTLAGPGVRRRGDLWHLWHPRMARRPGNRAYPGNENLANRYLDAAGDPAAMRTLVEAHTCRPS